MPGFVNIILDTSPLRITIKLSKAYPIAARQVASVSPRWGRLGREQSARGGGLWERLGE